MFYSMVDKCMTQWQKFSVFWQQAGHVEIQIVLVNTKPGKITLHFSVLMIEYLVATSYELWMIKYMLYFVALMTIAAEIVVEKSSICVW